MDPRERFSDRADDYARYRPSYSPHILAAIVEDYYPPIVADLGAGTGISSRLLADFGATVFAIEPNPRMRAAIANDPRITVLDTSAEATGLADASVNVVAAFQAYHWFEPDGVMMEALRIVRPGGRFAAVWNHRRLDHPFTRAYEQTISRYDSSEGKLDHVRRSELVIDDLRRYGWRNVRSISEGHQERISWETLIGRARSSSYLPWSGPAYAAMEADLRRFYDMWNPDERMFYYDTKLYLAESPVVE